MTEEGIIEWQKNVKDVSFKIYRDKGTFYHNTNVPVLDFESKSGEVTINLAKSPENRTLIRFLIGMLDIANNDASYTFYIRWAGDRHYRFLENYHWFNQMKITNEETHVNLVLRKKK